jgi:hypothetical protein
MLRPLFCKKAEPPIAVSDFIVAETASWNLQKLQEYFLPMDIEVIMPIPIGNARFDDFWDWHAW